MKKFYEAPSAEELVISSADILTASGGIGGVGGEGSDNSVKDPNWDLLT